MTQQELAERAGLSKDAISALERGVRRRAQPPTVRALATALGADAPRAAADALAIAICHFHHHGVSDKLGKALKRPR